jgi:hypothetical protein
MATNPKAATAAATAANAVAEEVESPQHHEAPITVTQFTQGTPDALVDVNNIVDVDNTPHPRDAHHNQSIPHPNVSDIAHELYNTFALHHDNKDVCSRLCKKSIVFSRFLFNGGPDADPSLATFIDDARFDNGRDALMIRNWCDPAHTFRGGPPAKAYNTNPNVIIPIDPFLYIDLVDDAAPYDSGANFAHLVDHARPFFHDVHFQSSSNVHPWVDLVDEYTHLHHGGGGDGGGGGGGDDDDDGGDDESNFSDDENDPEFYRKNLLKELKKKDTVISQGLNLARWVGGHLQGMRSKLSSLRYSISKYARMYEESPGFEVPPMLGYEFPAVDAPMTFYTEFKGWAEYAGEQVSKYCFISFFVLLICH